MVVTMGAAEEVVGGIVGFSVGFSVEVSRVVVSSMVDVVIMNG